MAGEKTEKATPKRKQDERKKGNVFMSKELVSIATLIAVFSALRFLLPSSIIRLEAFIAKYISLGSTTETLSMENLAPIYIDSILVYVWVAIPVLLISILAVVIATMAQTKMMFSPKAFEFKASRINPIEGFKRMFSLRSIVELLKAAIKIILLIYIIYLVLSDVILNLPNLMNMQPVQALAVTGSTIYDIVLYSGIVFLFLGIADYIYQWWQYEKNLRMSKQEIKDEYKQMEGNPQVKSQIRSLQQQMARRRMMQKVPQADVVIRNPTHYAVAIKYDNKKNNAPMVIAKGADELALRIIQVAEQNDVYVTENRPLARALFETVELDREIPSEFYQPVAEILAFIYKLKKGNVKK